MWHHLKFCDLAEATVVAGSEVKVLVKVGMSLGG